MPKPELVSVANKIQCFQSVLQRQIEVLHEALNEAHDSELHALRVTNQRLSEVNQKLSRQASGKDLPLDMMSNNFEYFEPKQTTGISVEDQEPKSVMNGFTNSGSCEVHPQFSDKSASALHPSKDTCQDAASTSLNNLEASESSSIYKYLALNRWEHMVARAEMFFLWNATEDGTGTYLRRTETPWDEAWSEEDSEAGVVREFLSRNRGGKVVKRGVSILQRFVARPTSGRRIIWDGIGMMLLLWDIATFPLVYAFQPADELPFEIMGWITAVFWLVDMPTQFFVGYMADGYLEMQPSKTALQYLRSYFLLDFSIVSCDWVFILMDFDSDADSIMRLGKVGKSGRMLRLLRTLRMARAGRYKDLMHDVSTMVNRERVRMALKFLSLVLMVVCMNHFIGCLWYAIGTSGWSDESWVKSKGLRDEGFLVQYATSFHWSITQFTPSSMEVSPKNVHERIFAIVVVLFGMIAFSSFISNITSAMTQLRNYDAAHLKREYDLRKFLDQNNISADLSNRLWGFIRANLNTHNMRAKESDVELLRNLPHNLQIEIRAETYLPTLNMHPFFRYLAKYDASVTLRICNTGVKHRTLLCAQELFQQGEHAKSMAFVATGKLRYTLRRSQAREQISLITTTRPRITGRKVWSGTSHKLAEKEDAEPAQEIGNVDSGSTPVRDISSGDVTPWVCEAALWADPAWVHCGWIVAVTISEIFEVDAVQLCSVTHWDLKAKETTTRHGFRRSEQVRRYAKYFQAHMREVGIGHVKGVTDVFTDLDVLQDMAQGAFKGESNVSATIPEDKTRRTYMRAWIPHTSRGVVSLGLGGPPSSPQTKRQGSSLECVLTPESEISP